MAAFSPGPRTSTDYARYVFELVRFDLLVNPGAVPSLGEASTKAFALPLPPLDEQARICEVLSAVNRDLSKATEKVAMAVDLLKERRAALISAAVTGKIDVRGIASAATVVSLADYRAPVGAAAIARLGRMGRMAVMKGGYLAESYAGMHELEGHYQRKAAGPYCASVMKGMEQGAARDHGIAVDEHDGERTTYDLPAGFSVPAAELRDRFGAERADRFLWLLKELSGFDRNGVEAVATLYAAWNDLLAQGAPVTDDAVHREVLENWHPEKSDRFTPAILVHWMAWMRRNDVVPDATAPRTDHQLPLL